MAKPKILVVDDEVLNVELLDGMLSHDYTVIKAFNGSDALIEIGKSLPDLILLDIMMPGINGYDVCKKIKGNEKSMHVPVVMVTALKERADRIKAIEAGADDFLSKPVDVYELTARVKSLVRVKQYHDALINEQDQLLIFKSAVDSMDDCVVITNVSGDIKYINPTFEKKYGYLQGDMIGKHISIIAHPRSPLLIDKESLLQDTRNEWGGNLTSVNKHGLTLKMSIKCSPIIKDKRRINLIFVMRQV
ncbi:MAG: response regulator [Candidatus Methanoperedens sp.]|nr:response regulator [Candidatus Methanoperedens sp.]